MDELDPRDRISVIGRVVDSINNLTFGDVRPYLHDDMIVAFPFALESFPTMQLDGADNFVSALSAIFTKYRTFKLTVDRTYVCPPDVVILEAHSNNIRIDGVPYNNSYVMIFEFEGDKIRSWKEYYNPSNMATAGSALLK